MFWRTSIRWIVIGSLSLLLACGGPSEIEDARVADAMEQLQPDHIARIIGQFSDNYLAVVQEVVDDTGCYGPSGGSCLVSVRVVEYLGGNPPRLAAEVVGWEYQTLEARMEEAWPNRRVGRKRLVISVPLEKPGVFGSKLFILDPTPDEVDKLRGLIGATLTNESQSGAV